MTNKDLIDNEWIVMNLSQFSLFKCRNQDSYNWECNNVLNAKLI